MTPCSQPSWMAHFSPRSYELEVQDKYQRIQLDKSPTSITGVCFNLQEDIIRNSRDSEFNFNAKTHYNMVNGQDCQLLSKPPVTIILMKTFKNLHSRAVGWATTWCSIFPAILKQCKGQLSLQLKHCFPWLDKKNVIAWLKMSLNHDVKCKNWTQRKILAFSS